MIRRSTKLQLINLAFLAIVFLILVLRSVSEGTYVNWINWPGGTLIALAVLSSFVLAIRPIQISEFLSKGMVLLAGYAFFFGVSLMLLTDLFVVIFERFFRFEEHLTIGQLPEKWMKEWYRIGEGILVFCIYRVINLYFIQKDYVFKNQQFIYDLESKASDASLKSLRTELNPHFLFNAMNSIAMIIRIKENDKAVKMISNLNELLRASLGKSEEVFVTLKEELDLLDRYLAIELVRFGDRVAVEINVEDGVLKELVPQLILQPIVENAFKHGMTDDLGNQRLTIACREEGDRLVMTVFNTTKSEMNIGKLYMENSGVGLSNTIKRLRQLYSTKFKFQLEQRKDGIEFKIQIPLRK